MNNEKKICSQCNEEKKLENFYFIKQENRYNKRCKFCINLYNKNKYTQVKILPKIKVIEKTCIDCHILKPINKFNKESKQKDGYNNHCKICYQKLQKCYYLDYHPKSYCTPNHKICNKCKIERPFENFYPSLKGLFKLHPRCKECCRVDSKERSQTKNYKRRANQWAKDKKKSNPEFKLKCLIRGRIKDALKRIINGAVPREHTSSKILLGCTIIFYKLYLESLFLPEFTWSNHGEIWEIDHIKPCASFDLTQESEQLKCFNYKNTMPRFKTTLIAESFGYKDYIGNREKGDKIM